MVTLPRNKALVITNVRILVLHDYVKCFYIAKQLKHKKPFQFRLTERISVFLWRISPWWRYTLTVLTSDFSGSYAVWTWWWGDAQSSALPRNGQQFPFHIFYPFYSLYSSYFYLGIDFQGKSHSDILPVVK